MRDLLDHILVPREEERITIPEIEAHSWCVFHAAFEFIRLLPLRRGNNMLTRDAKIQAAPLRTRACVQCAMKPPLPPFALLLSPPPHMVGSGVQ